MQPEEVRLYRYDLTQGMAAQMSPMLLGRRIEAVWHTAIVVYGHEFYFDGGVGICMESPGSTRFGRPLRTEVLGRTNKSRQEFLQWVHQMRRDGFFGPNDYNLLRRNCNHFSQEASMFLLGRNIPDDVRHMIDQLLSTPLGSMVRPMLEEMTHSGSTTGGSARSPLQPPPSTAAPSTNRPPVAAAEIGRGLLSIKSGLSNDDVEAVQLAIALVESALPSSEATAPECIAFLLSLRTLQSVFENALKNPNEPKYRRLKCSSATYREKLLGLSNNNSDPGFSEMIEELLHIAGFVGEEESGETWWVLKDSNASVGVLTALRDEIRLTCERRTSSTTPAPSPPPPPLNTATTINSAVAPGSNTVSSSSTTATAPLLFSSTRRPSPAGYVPLPVGTENEQVLYFGRVNGLHPAKVVTDGAAIKTLPAAVSGHFLSVCLNEPLQDGQTAASLVECGINPLQDAVEILLVTASCNCDTAVKWVPLWLAASCSRNEGVPMSAFCVRQPSDHSTDDGRRALLVARSAYGAGIHPAWAYQKDGASSSIEVVISYGGRGVVVTQTAEVLCFCSHLPQSLLTALQTYEQDKNRAQQKRRLVCAPLSSIDALLAWEQPLGETSCFAPLRYSDWEPHETASQDRLRLLVCHDFKGGYLPSDTPTFSCGGGDPSAQLATLLTDAYTFHAWDATDAFVYFSHARVSVPPRDWIECGHRHGVPVLGTFITEWTEGRMEWQAILSNPQRMGAVIQKLVDVADYYGFDGYLINVETEIAATHVKRLVAFVSYLRTTLLERRKSKARAMVVWYDAVTAEGRVSYQNALTQRNKVFFDASDAIFLNYFWRPDSLHANLTHCDASRVRDVFVGVDCFGRSTFGGGGFACDVAVKAIADSGCAAVALFAPGWTLEKATTTTAVDPDVRKAFCIADRKFWNKLSPKYFAGGSKQVSAVDHQRGVYCDFSTGAGTSFYWRGRNVSNGAWVQRASQSPWRLDTVSPPTATDGADHGGLEVMHLTLVTDTHARVGVIPCVVKRAPPAVFKDETTTTNRVSPFVGDTFVSIPSSPSRGGGGETSLIVLLSGARIAAQSSETSSVVVLRLAWRCDDAGGAPAVIVRAAQISPPFVYRVSLGDEALVDSTTHDVVSGWTLSCVQVELPSSVFSEEGQTLVDICLQPSTDQQTVDIGFVSLAVAPASSPSNSVTNIISKTCVNVMVRSGSASTDKTVLMFFSTNPHDTAPSSACRLHYLFATFLHRPTDIITSEETETDTKAKEHVCFLGVHYLPSNTTTAATSSSSPTDDELSQWCWVDVEVRLPVSISRERGTWQVTRVEAVDCVSAQEGTIWEA